MAWGGSGCSEAAGEAEMQSRHSERIATSVQLGLLPHKVKKPSSNWDGNNLTQGSVPGRRASSCDTCAVPGKCATACDTGVVPSICVYLCRHPALALKLTIPRVTVGWGHCTCLLPKPCNCAASALLLWVRTRTSKSSLSADVHTQYCHTTTTYIPTDQWHMPLRIWWVKYKLGATFW